MLWSEVRTTYPNQWLVVEALEAHTTQDSRRRLDRIAVVEKCPDGSAAMKGCRQLYRDYPTREFYFVHTSRDDLEIRERNWHGIRRGHDAGAKV